ncbi:hypothetical protein H4R99_004333 [Coemansia sp. RSA 1722]|nr:hypothetical protein LPJ57_005544 [Coemansia sp. RSA 486]KAJ2232279.1 hypothetical protein IWW45_005087 [Coemansia sp. RSA 485]KAJ2597869.1 hypothetical protein H4R99_004333 [Coemansia sp. RSA 1722]KAJ2602284.1 hypothetical protein GGF39_000774 [Coemansia sp. RSA 1721]KAJ2640444.1 hypothetical protein GGF40_000092 [Coemansia sp. RSA 1286]
MAGRKRRRDHEDQHSDIYGNSDPGYEAHKRQRSAKDSYRNIATDADNEKSGSEDRPVGGDEAMGFGLEMVFYDKDAGFNIDTTADNVLDPDVQYRRGTSMVVGMEPTLLSGNLCFNCSLPGHEIRECPMPLDKERVEANRNAFNAKGSGQFGGRLYLSVEEETHMNDMREKYRPGQPLSQTLSEALGLQHRDDIPEYIQRMHYFGYPPAYLGSSAEQDPMTARLGSMPKPPSTPPLIVYNEDADYDKQAGQERVPGSAVETESKVDSGADTEDSDEEGAISDDGNGNGDSAEITQVEESVEPEKPRNIPLVHYHGLDLSRFDFAADSDPGKPLPMQIASHYSRNKNSPQQDGRGRSPVYEDRFRNSRYNDDYYQDHKQRYVSKGYNKSYGSRDRYNDGYNGRDDYGNGDWDGALNGYYRSDSYHDSERQHADNRRYHHHHYNDSRNSDYVGFDGYRDSPRRYDDRYSNYEQGCYGYPRGYGNIPAADGPLPPPSYSPALAEPQPLPSWPSAVSCTTQTSVIENAGELSRYSAQDSLKTTDFAVADEYGNGDSDAEDGECDMEESE